MNKISYGIVKLCSIKTLINLKVNKKLDSQIQTKSVAVQSAVYLLGPLLNNFANLTNTKIWFNEIIIMEAFISKPLLMKHISDKYVYELKRQVYTIIGSSDMLGNPSNLLGKVGTGFFELARDPLQGMMQGPTGFAKGVKSGSQSAIGKVIGGGFDSLSHVSGSLYSVIKETTGNEDNR